jgi:hypothetical protein
MNVKKKSGYVYLSNHGGVLKYVEGNGSQYLPLKRSACDTFMVLFIDMFVYGNTIFILANRQKIKML